MNSFPNYRTDVGLSVLLVAVLAWHFSGIAPEWSNAALIGISFVGFVPVLSGVWKALREREWASMDLLASVALLFSLLSYEWVSAVFIELMLAAARILDDVTRDRTEKSIRGLLKLRPETAQVERNGALLTTHIEDIRVEDVVIIGIGERVPVDGVVLSGTGAVDESSLTGESLPVDKNPGSKVMSSTLVSSGSLKVKTTHTGKDTTLERVIKLVESAREEKPTSQTLGEKFGKIYLVSIFVGSALLYIVTQNLPLVLAVVLVVCADDVAVAIPIAYLRAIRSAARHGVIVKGGKHLEILGKLDTLVFDKTGTLTTGVLAVTSVVPVQGRTEEEILKTGSLAAIRSTHPMSRAFLAYAKERGLGTELPDSAEEKGGRGVVAKKGSDSITVGRRVLLEELHIAIPGELLAAADTAADQGHSALYVALNNNVLGFVAAADKVKPNAAKAITHMRELGIRKFVMLTGDNPRVAAAIAKQVGVDEWHADLLPEGKVEIIRTLQSERPVAMVGDGVNDAAALSIASVGIAMGGLGTEGTIESAQIVLMHDNLAALPLAINVARFADKVSRQDFWIWGSTNAAGLALVFGGLIGPAGAAAYNFLSDFLPLFNSFRVRVIRKLQQHDESH